jgi:pimeloyl-ACP methyl ester carboxylesterase
VAQVLYGTEDVRSPLSVAREMNRRIPGSTLVMIPDVGHVGAVEALDAFNAEVRRFLRGVAVVDAC